MGRSHPSAKYPAAIVDDEERGIRALASLIVRNHPEIELVGQATSVPTGLELVRRTAPRLLFLDIELGGRSAFELLQALGEQRPHVIFTTAHENYMLQAIRYSALDYLLKPIGAADLREALARACRIMNGPVRNDQMDILLKNVGRAAGERVVALPVSDGFEMVPVSEIVHCTSDGNYCTVHLRGRRHLVLSRSLKDMEQLLEGTVFVRVHHTHLVNTRHVVKYVRGEGGTVTLSTGVSLEVSRRKKQELLDALGR